MFAGLLFSIGINFSNDANILTYKKLKGLNIHLHIICCINNSNGDTTTQARNWFDFSIHLNVIDVSLVQSDFVRRGQNPVIYIYSCRFYLCQGQASMALTQTGSVTCVQQTAHTPLNLALCFNMTNSKTFVYMYIVLFSSTILSSAKIVFITVHNMLI